MVMGLVRVGLVLAVMGGMAGCNVSKDHLNAASQREQAALRELDDEIARMEKLARNTEEGLAVVLPQARGKLNQLDEKAARIEADLKDGRAKVAAIKERVEARRTAALELPRRKMKADDLAAHESAVTREVPKEMEALNAAEAVLRRAQEAMLALGRGVANVQKGLDEGGADSDGE